MNRFELERAVETSSLPRGARDVVFALARRLNYETGLIPDRNMPSLTELQRVIPMSRSGLCYCLAIAEQAGWVIRQRPGAAEQRRTHARTSYVLRIPGTPELVQSSRNGRPRDADMWSRAAARAAAREAAQGVVQ